LSTHQVYRSTLQVYANRARAHPISMQFVTSTTRGLYNPCSITHQVLTYNISTPQVKQAVSDTPLIYINHSKHTRGLYKTYRTHLRSIEAARTPLIYTNQAYHGSIEAALRIPKIYVGYISNPYVPVYTGRGGYGWYRPMVYSSRLVST